MPITKDEILDYTKSSKRLMEKILFEQGDGESLVDLKCIMDMVTKLSRELGHQDPAAAGIEMIKKDPWLAHVHKMDYQP